MSTLTLKVEATAAQNQITSLREAIEQLKLEAAGGVGGNYDRVSVQLEKYARQVGVLKRENRDLQAQMKTGSDAAVSGTHKEIVALEQKIAAEKAAGLAAEASAEKVKRLSEVVRTTRGGMTAELARDITTTTSTIGGVKHVAKDVDVLVDTAADEKERLKLKSLSEKQQTELHFASIAEQKKVDQWYFDIWKVYEKEKLRVKGLTEKQQTELHFASIAEQKKVDQWYARGRASLLTGGIAAQEKAEAEQVVIVTRAEKLKRVARAETALFDKGTVGGLERGASRALGGPWTSAAMAPTLVSFAAAASLAKAVKDGTEFMYLMQAVRGVAQESAGAIDEAGAAVLRLGEQSLVGPVELAKGLHILVQAGYSTKDAMTALPSVVALATVGQLSLSQAVTISSSAMHQFNLNAFDMGHVSDAIAKSAALSATSVEQIGTALGYTNNLATEFGFTMEETLAMLSAMSSRGIAGSKAGTSLNQMFSHLTSGAPKVTAALKQLNLELYNDQGEFRGPLPILRELKQTLSGYTQQGQISFLQSMFGVRDMKAAVVLLDEINDKVVKFKKEVETSSTGLGFATEAKILEMDTARGAAERTANVIQSTFIQASLESEGALKSLAVAVREVFADPAVRQGMASTIIRLAQFAEAVVELREPLMWVGKAFLAWKLAQWAEGITVVRTVMLSLGLATQSAAAATAELAAAELAAAAATKQVTFALTYSGWGAILVTIGLAAMALREFLSVQKEINALPDPSEKQKGLLEAAQSQLEEAKKRNRQAKGELSANDVRATAQSDYEFYAGRAAIAASTLGRLQSEYDTEREGDSGYLSDRAMTLYGAITSTRKEWMAADAAAKGYKKTLDEVVVSTDERARLDKETDELNKAKEKNKYGVNDRVVPETSGELSAALRAESGDASREISLADFDAAHERRMLAFTREGEAAATYAREQEQLEARLAARKIGIIDNYLGKVADLSSDTKGKAEEQAKLEALRTRTETEEKYRVQESAASKLNELNKWATANEAALNKKASDIQAETARQAGVGELAFVVDASAEKIKAGEAGLAEMTAIRRRYEEAWVTGDVETQERLSRQGVQAQQNYAAEIIAIDTATTAKIVELQRVQAKSYAAAAHERELSTRALGQTGVISGYRSAKDIAQEARDREEYAYTTVANELQDTAGKNVDNASFLSDKLAIAKNYNSDLEALNKDHQGKLTLQEKEAQRALTKERYDSYSAYTGMASTALGTIADMIGTNSKESFEKAKKYRVAAALLDTAGGAVKAFAETPGGIYAMIAAAAVATAVGLARVQQIRNTEFKGQAHDGLPFVPSTGTYTLEKGERVVKQEDNKKLQNFLERPQATRSPSVTQVSVNIQAVDAPGVARLLSQNQGLISGLVQKSYDERLRSGGPYR